jgi:hypothetical protein
VILQRLRVDESSLGRCGVAASPFNFGAVGYIERPSDVDLIGDEQFAAGTKIVLALPHLVLASVFPLEGFEYDLEKDDSMFYDLWPGAWRASTNTSPVVETDPLRCLKSLAAKVDVSYRIPVNRS